MTVAGEPAHEPDRGEEASGESSDGDPTAREPDGEHAGAAAATGTGNSLRDLGTVYLKGTAMGAADTIPGVSGGTIALITGIYERFVRALTRLDPRILRHVPRLHRAEGRRDLLADLREMDFFFLVALGLGVVTSVVTLSRVMHLALETARAPTFAFFLGLIAASAVVLYGELNLESAGQAVAGLGGFGLAFLLSGAAAEGLLGNGLPVIFAVGAVAVTAMVLPGISGSFILILLGQYYYLTGVLGEFVDGVIAVVTGGAAGNLPSLATVVVTFVAGAVVGLVSVAHLIRWALDAYRTATLVFLVSLMVGSLRLPVVEVTTNVDAWTPAAAGLITLAVVVGAGAVLLLDYYTADLSGMAN